jgi:hypothetical protein
MAQILQPNQDARYAFRKRRKAYRRASALRVNALCLRANRERLRAGVVNMRSISADEAS